MRQRAEMRRSTRLWLEVTRPRRFSRFNQQLGVERECLALRGRRQRHSGGPAASWQDWPRTISAAFASRHDALPHLSRADDAQKGQNGNQNRLLGARPFRRLHGRRVTDCLFPEKVTAQCGSVSAAHECEHLLGAA